MHREPGFGDGFQGASGKPDLRLQRHIWIIHGTGADGADDSFPGQLTPQQVDGIGLNQHIMVEIFDLVALGARVAVDALVLAAAVQVHVVVEPEPFVGPFDTHQQGFDLYLFDHGCIEWDK